MDGLIATMAFDTRTGLHVHLSDLAQDIANHDPLEWARTLRTFEAALRDYQALLERHRRTLELRIEEADEAREATA